MTPYIGMPQGAEWLVILAIVVLLFGSAKLPTLVRQLGRSKKIWEEEVTPGKNKPEAELTQGVQPIAYPTQAPVQQPVQQVPVQPVQQAPVQQQPLQTPPNQVNGQAPGDGLPPTHSAN